MSALPPNISPLTLANAGREYRVSTEDHGKILFFGNACDGRVGTMVLQFVPDISWEGTLVVMGRVYGHPASDNGVAFGSIPYRRVALSGIASDRAIVTGADPALALTGAFLIEVPANGLVIGLLASVQNGFGTVYSWPLNGPAT